MRNLEKFGVLELNTKELNCTEGGTLNPFGHIVEIAAFGLGFHSTFWSAVKEAANSVTDSHYDAYH
ncbi:hypothetical protein BWZ22_07200 [Seonamhaeicola sp. S2-3]|uniref:hypothetical protein n=1 Tax=Seonamhaeicola sp. S2-3 TaxID=1936081 RepID=UPI000972E0BB|nr:hypothetical protein [Seonamhaeicola sp. S2-3]APY11040.1 hypothetical protein BWZ22_07200 [Seonamhaeicola sp. S2-3]